MILVGFKCRHTCQVDEAALSPPVCAICGETQIVRSTAPPPTFRGAASGPCAVAESKVRPVKVPVVPYADAPEEETPDA